MTNRDEFLSIYCAALNGLLARGESVADSTALARTLAREGIAAIDAELHAPTMPSPPLPAPPPAPLYLAYAPPAMPMTLTAESLCPICRLGRNGEIPEGSPSATQCKFLHYRPFGHLPVPE